MPSDTPSIGAHLSGVSREIGGLFEHDELPAALRLALGYRERTASRRASDAVQRMLCDPTLSGVVLAGPGVLGTGKTRALRRFAAVRSLGVANTWGAKGLFRWDDPHHLGTCGLQRDDFALLGFDKYDFIVAVGVDHNESPLDRFALAPVVVVDPQQLRTPRSSNSREPPIRVTNKLYERLSAIASSGYQSDREPRHPARAVADLKATLSKDTLMTAQADLAGLWVARTFPTDRPGSVSLPARAVPGIGPAMALVATLHGRTAVSVVSAPVDEVAAEIFELAAKRDLPLRAEVLGRDVDWTVTSELLRAAGPVVAWNGALASPAG